MVWYLGDSSSWRCLGYTSLFAPAFPPRAQPLSRRAHRRSLESVLPSPWDPVRWREHRLWCNHTTYAKHEINTLKYVNKIRNILQDIFQHKERLCWRYAISDQHGFISLQLPVQRAIPGCTTMVNIVANTNKRNTVIMGGDVMEVR